MQKSLQGTNISDVGKDSMNCSLSVKIAELLQLNAFCIAVYQCIIDTTVYTYVP